MRTIGSKLPEITSAPRAKAMQDAANGERLAAALAAVHSTGIVKGIYRFATHADADAQRLEGLVRVVAANALVRRRSRRQAE